MVDSGHMLFSCTSPATRPDCRLWVLEQHFKDVFHDQRKEERAAAKMDKQRVEERKDERMADKENRKSGNIARAPMSGGETPSTRLQLEQQWKSSRQKRKLAR